MTGQPRAMSWLETIASTAIGYSVALTGQLVVFPLLHISVSLHQNLLIGAFFTVLSIVRGYCVRRLFNWLHVRGYGVNQPAGEPVVDYSSELEYHRQFDD